MSGLGANLSPVSELAIDLDRDGGDALHRQIEASIRHRIRSGVLPAGVALPPTRALAAELGVTRGVVVEAYAQLVAEGYLTSRRGGYTQVAAAAAAPPAPRGGLIFGYSNLSERTIEDGIARLARAVSSLRTGMISQQNTSTW